MTHNPSRPAPHDRPAPGQNQSMPLLAACFALKSSAIVALLTLSNPA